jgi:hypothetical protein
MTPEQKDALCEYVDGQREACRRYDEIAANLAGKLPEDDLEKLEVWHRQWKRRQWRDEMKRQQTDVPIGDSDFAAGEPEIEEWSGGTPRGEREVVRYLAERLIGHETKGSKKPRWRVEKGLSEWSASGAENVTRPFLALYLRHETPERRQWRPLYTRSLTEGQTCEFVKGPGHEGGTRWLHCAVIFRTGGRIDHVEAEARIRRRVYPEKKRGRDLGLLREAVDLEKLHLVRQKLDQEEISARLAALLQTYLGKGSGIKSGAHLGRLTNRTRQAVSARKLLIAEDYYEVTGGRSGFEGVSSAARHRAKVTAKQTASELE